MGISEFCVLFLIFLVGLGTTDLLLAVGVGISDLFVVGMGIGDLFVVGVGISDLLLVVGVAISDLHSYFL